jgi:hypothetical protein
VSIRAGIGEALMRDIYWAPQSGVGLEHVRFTWLTDRVTADGMILRSVQGDSQRIHYAIECDRTFHTTRVFAATLLPNTKSIDIRSDGRGVWSDARGEALHELAGCIDVDIAATPFTNTLPIRRLELHPGQSATLDIAYIDTSSLALTRATQRYTCLQRRGAGGQYRYENVTSGFTAVLEVDADGIVLDYPALFRRIGSGS